MLSKEGFEKDKNELMTELENASSFAETANLPATVIVQRDRPRPFGQYKTHLFFDSVKRKDLDLDKKVELTVSPGKHTLFFQLGISSRKSKEISFEAKAGKICNIVFSVKAFSVAVEITEV